jgi:hypothetical protein
MRTSSFAALAAASLFLAAGAPVLAAGSAVGSYDYVDIGFGSLTAPDGNRYGMQATARHTQGPGGDSVQLYVLVYQLVPNAWGWDDWVYLAFYSGSSSSEPQIAKVEVIADKSASIRGSFIPQFGTISGPLSLAAECFPSYTSSFVYNSRYRNNVLLGDGNQHQVGNSFGGECTVTLQGSGLDWTFSSSGSIVQAIRSVAN